MHRHHTHTRTNPTPSRLRLKPTTPTKALANPTGERFRLPTTCRPRVLCSSNTTRVLSVATNGLRRPATPGAPDLGLAPSSPPGPGGKTRTSANEHCNRTKARKVKPIQATPHSPSQLPVRGAATKDVRLPKGLRCIRKPTYPECRCGRHSTFSGPRIHALLS